MSHGNLYLEVKRPVRLIPWLLIASPAVSLAMLVIELHIWHISPPSTFQAENIHATQDISADGVVKLYKTLNHQESFLTKIDVFLDGTVDTTLVPVRIAAVSGQAASVKIAGGFQSTNIGVYGEAANGDNNFAGYFDGEVLVVGPTVSTGTLFATDAAQSISTSGFVHDAGGAATVTACGTAIPVSNTNEYSGLVTEGTGATGCVITFAVPIAPAASAATCVVSSQSGLKFSYVASQTAITVTNIDDLSGTGISYICLAHS